MVSLKKSNRVIKCGNIGTVFPFELLLDELADREDITIRTVTIGSKMIAEVVEEINVKRYSTI